MLMTTCLNIRVFFIISILFLKPHSMAISAMLFLPMEIHIPVGTEANQNILLTTVVDL